MFARSVLLVALLALPALAADPPKPKPVKVFVLAGQSNMEGQAVVDLEGKDYNQGRATVLQCLSPSTVQSLISPLSRALVPSAAKY